MNRIFRKFSKPGIKGRFQYIFFGLFIVAFILCFLLFVYVFRMQLKSTYKSKNEDKLNSVSKSFQSVMDNASSISLQLTVNDVVRGYLEPQSRKNKLLSNQKNAVREEIYRTIIAYPGNYMVFLSRLPDDPLNGPANFEGCVSASIGLTTPITDTFFSESWYGRAREKKGGYIVFSDNSKAFDHNQYLESVSVARVMNSIVTQEEIGFLVINIPVRQLGDTYSEFTASDDSDFAYVDANGKCIVSNMDDESLGKMLEEIKGYNRKETVHVFCSKSDRIISSRRITETGIYLICSSKISYINNMDPGLIALSLGMFIIIVLMFSIIGNYIGKNIIDPITALSANMQVTDGNVPEQIKNFPDRDDEIGILQKQYNKMTLQINKLLETVVEEEQQRRKAETKVIQEQMKPHFLYNTLATIGCMALQNSREEVYDALETLSLFYRKFLSKGSETITVADEISIVQSYVKLLRLRYDDMFEDVYEIEPGLESAVIIKLILQPLVENSIYHGIREKGEYGIIKISVFSENNRIHIKVYDSGVGMSQEQTEALLSGENDKSFGFKGTLTRIKNFYQNDAYVSINSTEGEFCEIDINIPWQR